ncbi:MAG: NUDIX domain-containing protein, partial [Thiohalospira sp.]
MNQGEEPVELLSRIIEHEERVFEPDDDSREALGAFQPVVEAICHLGDDGFLDIREPERDENSPMGYYNRVEVVSVRPSARKMLERARARARGDLPGSMEEGEQSPFVAEEASPSTDAGPRSVVEGPRVGVGAVVVHEGRILLVRRGGPPRAGMWTVPGGKPAFGETLQEAVEREVREETGITVAAGAPLQTFELQEADEQGELVWHYVIINLRAEYLDGEPSAASDAADAAWCTPEEVME